MKKNIINPKTTKKTFLKSKNIGNTYTLRITSSHAKTGINIKNKPPKNNEILRMLNKIDFDFEIKIPEKIKIIPNNMQKNKVL